MAEATHEKTDVNEPNEPQYSKANEGLSALDDASAKGLTWRQLRTCLVSSTGFFMDSYDIFVIGLIVPMLGYVYYPGTNTVPAAISGPLKGMTNVGNLIGQLLFGYLADTLGRKRIYGIELVIIIIATIGCAMAGTAAVGVGTLGFLGFWRVLLGIGIGGDYPMSATVSSEWSSAGRRGQMVALTFSMQGWGQLAGALVTIIFLAIFQYSIDLNVLNIDYLWRIVAAFGAVPAVCTVYYRFVLPESPQYAEHVLHDAEATAEALKYVNVGEPITKLDGEGEDEVKPAHIRAAEKKQHMKEFWQHFGQWKHGKVLVGTCVTWFLLDIAFYGTTLNQPIVLSAIGFAPPGQPAWNTLWNQAVGNLILTLLGAIPGYYATVFLIERIGRKTIQLIGFAAETVLFIIIAVAYYQLKADALAALVVLFTLVQFFFQFGANSTTFVIPAEVFPTRFRATAFGISAASGKAGAIIAAFGFNVVVNIGGTNAFLPQTLGIFAAIMALGFAFTFLIPESKGKSLAYFEANDD